MPIYEYRCESCAGKFEVLTRFAERDSAQACPSCESTRTRVLVSSFAVSGGEAGSSLDFGSEQTSADNLTTKVKDRLANKADKRVYVKADMRCRFGGVVQVVDAVRAAGVDDLGLLTDQRKTSTPPPAPPAAGQ